MYTSTKCACGVQTTIIDISWSYHGLFTFKTSWTLVLSQKTPFEKLLWPYCSHFKVFSWRPLLSRKLIGHQAFTSHAWCHYLSLRNPVSCSSRINFFLAVAISHAHVQEIFSPIVLLLLSDHWQIPFVDFNDLMFPL